jgi:acetyl-CoA/propionyl-CoA carboxylase biotin carboxyl carrier protein
MFHTVLVANRGEIAVRVIRTLHGLGIRAVAVYSDADATARHVAVADVAVHIGAAPARESYLNGERIIAAALLTGAQAIHPGYGFLAENADFARSCAAAGLVFIGPSVEAINAMGDKIRAKQAMVTAGVPVVPGRNHSGMADADLVEAADQVGFPVLVKPSAGGGGKGIHLVTAPGDLPEALVAARREAAASFGDDTLLIERFVVRPRHIEIQVLADNHGHVIHLGERECSLQRRHQKVIEEAPSPLLTPVSRAAMGAAAVAAAAAVSYSGAGTVEFIVSADTPDDFFFMEMNTRLQVEHPVTEMVTGLDLVAWQLRIAAGEHLTVQQSEVALRGHAIEARVYAEDPARGFLPTGGSLLAVEEPAGTGVRVDSGIRIGTIVGSSYDPMLAKVIAHGDDRATALARLDRALSDTVILGIGTNISFLRNLIADSDVAAGILHTELIDERLDTLTRADAPDAVVAAATLLLATQLIPVDQSQEVWARQDGWRIGDSAWTTRRLQVGDRSVTTQVRGTSVRLDDQEPVTVELLSTGTVATVAYSGLTAHYSIAWDGASLWIGRDGGSWKVTTSTGPEHAGAGRRGASDGRIVSPLPGTVVSVRVAAGDDVAVGQPLLVVEAMKMEHTLVAPHDGVVTNLAVKEGQSVAMDELLVDVAVAPDSDLLQGRVS